MRLPAKNSEVVRYLASKTVDAGFVDKLKIRYRPLICPFIPLLELANGKTSAFDIGCGSGQFCSVLAHYTDIQRIKGIDVSDGLIANAREISRDFQNSKTLQFACFNGSDIPDDIADYELVYMIDVFHHIPPKIRLDFVAQLYTRMQPDATLVFKDMDAASPLVVFNKLHDTIFGGGAGQEISLTAARTTLERSGFRIRNTFRRTQAVYAHYFVVCDK